jgi:hypothetical protein
MRAVARPNLISATRDKTVPYARSLHALYISRQPTAVLFTG